MKQALIKHRHSVLRAHGERRGVRRAEGSSVRAALQPTPNGIIQREDGELVELEEGGDGHHGARCLRLDATDEDVAVSAVIELVDEDFLGREEQLSAPRSSTSQLPQARYIHI